MKRVFEPATQFLEGSWNFVAVSREMANTIRIPYPRPSLWTGVLPRLDFDMSTQMTDWNTSVSEWNNYVAPKEDQNIQFIVPKFKKEKLTTVSFRYVRVCRKW